MVLIWIVNGLAFFFLCSYVGGELFLESEELGEVFDNIDFDLSLVHTDILRLFTFGNRLDFRLCAKELAKVTPKTSNFFIYANNFISSTLDLDKRFFGLLV